MVSFHYLPEEECVNIYGFDIGEQKELEVKLRESEVRFRSVLDNSVDVIYRVKVQTGRYEYISPSIEVAIGFSPDWHLF